MAICQPQNRLGDSENFKKATLNLISCLKSRIIYCKIIIPPQRTLLQFSKNSIGVTNIHMKNLLMHNVKIENKFLNAS